MSLRDNTTLFSSSFSFSKNLKFSNVCNMQIVLKEHLWLFYSSCTGEPLLNKLWKDVRIFYSLVKFFTTASYCQSSSLVCKPNGLFNGINSLHFKHAIWYVDIAAHIFVTEYKIYLGYIQQNKTKKKKDFRLSHLKWSLIMLHTNIQLKNAKETYYT